MDGYYYKMNKPINKWLGNHVAIKKTLIGFWKNMRKNDKEQYTNEQTILYSLTFKDQGGRTLNFPETINHYAKFL